MRLATYEDRAIVVVGGLGIGIEKGIDIEKASDGLFSADIHDAYRRFDEFGRWWRAWSGDLATFRLDATFPLDPTRLGPPAPRPAQVFALGLNYADHAAEGGFDAPEAPVVFTKFPSCVTGPYAEVALPAGNVDWEVELVAVIGRATAGPVSAAEGWRYVAGLTVGQDLSERVTQHRPPAPQFSLGKSYPSFGPLGPVLVTPDEFDDPDDLELRCRRNGETMQHARTSSMIFSVPAIVAYLSGIVRLLPGDVIFTGTPDGVGRVRTPPVFLKPGDVLESEIENVGTIRQTFTAGPTGGGGTP